MPETISIYDTTVSRFFARIRVRSSILQIRRPTTVVVNGIAPFVPLFLEQVGDASTRKEIASRVQGRHLSLQNQSRPRTRAKKKERKPGVKIPRPRPESWRLPESETRQETHRASRLSSGARINDRFEMYVPLHRLWLGYVSELLGLGPQPAGTVTEQNAAMPNVATVHAKLVKADLHGSIMTGGRCLMGLYLVANQ